MPIDEGRRGGLNQAVILAGGKGARLAERLGGRPKPLVDVDGVPLLERQIAFLKRYGISEIVVLVNHSADQIAAFCASRDNFRVDLTLIDDGVPRGTAGAVLECLDTLAERFLVIYGDTLFDIDIDQFHAAHDRAGADGTLFLHPNDHPFDSDLVEIGDDGAILELHPSPHASDKYLPNLVNAAFYLLEKRAFEPWRNFPSPADFGKDLFPAMLKSGARLHGYNSFEYIKDLGTPKRLDKVVAHLRSGLVERAQLSTPQACVFVDRDGTLNALRDYVRNASELELLAGVPEAVRRLNDAEFRLALITNQPVIARGECSFAEMGHIHAKLETELGRVGAYLDRIYICPHHPDSGFPGEIASLKVQCRCRKPEAGMIEDGMHDLNTNPRRSWMIGDSTSDLLAARRAGLRSILVRTGEAGLDGKYTAAPDFTAQNFPAAVDFILTRYPAMVDELGPILESVRPGNVVLVGGAPRTGKSTVSSVLTHELRRRGISTSLIRLDGWIRSARDRDPGKGLAGRYDFAAAFKALGPWFGGDQIEIEVPFYDRGRQEKRTGEVEKIAADSVLILEGVPALIAPIDTARGILRIHVRSGEIGRRDRVIGDLVSRGLTTVEEAERIFAAREHDEVCIVEGAAQNADYMISLDDIFALGRIPGMSHDYQ